MPLWEVSSKKTDLYRKTVKMKKWPFFLLLFLIATAWSAPEDNDWQAKVAPELLQTLADGQNASFLVRFHAQADVSQARQAGSKTERGRYVYERTRALAQRTQQRARRLLEERGADYRSFYIVNAMACQGGLQLAKALAQLPEVAQLQSNPSVKLDLLPSSSAADALSFREGVEWGLAAIGADQVWDLGYTGQGVVIGGQDTGYEWHHPAIQGSYRGWDGDTADHNYNWHDAIHAIDSLNGPPFEASANPCGLSSLVPCDDNNHGTHTMGTMTGTVSDEGKRIGVAPDARWIACRNMERGYGSPASYIECFEWFLAPTDLNGENPKPALAPHVIANSWSCPEMEGCTPANFEIMQLAVDHLKAAGVVVVVSAGNSGSGCHTVSTPAAIFESSFSVGATRQNDTIANFSSRGTVLVDGSNRLKPEVSAPGVNIRSSIRNEGYATYSGTSMAGPHVAGAVALLISANPALAGQVELIEELLQTTAKPMLSDQDCGGYLGSEVPNAVYGYGRIDALAAVQKALLITAAQTQEPSASLQVSPNPTTGPIALALDRALSQPGLFQLLDSQGRIALERAWPEQQQQLTVTLADQAAGVYFYRLSSGQTVWSGKVIKF